MTAAAQDRTLLAIAMAIVPVTALVIRPGLADPFVVPKFAVLLIAAGLAAGTIAAGAVRNREVLLPPRGWLIAVGAYAVALLPGTLAADTLLAAVFGSRARLRGVLLHVAVVAVGITVATVIRQRPERLRWLATALGGTVLALAVVALHETISGAVLGIENDLRGLQLTLGNSNFAGAFTGALTPVALALALRSGPSRLCRAGWLAVAALGFAAALGTTAVQGPVTAGAATLVLLAALAVRLPRRRRRWAVAALATVAVTGAALLAAGLTDRGPLASAGALWTLDARVIFWRGSASVFAANPLTGAGLDQLDNVIRRHRPVEAATFFELGHIEDSAHNVVLQLLATGGVALGVAFIAVVLLTGMAAVRGLRLLDGDDRVVFAGLVAAWVGYLVQASVSIDMVPLAVLHWTLAGALVGTVGCVRTLRWGPAAPATRRQKSPAPIEGAAWRVPVAWTMVLALPVAGAVLAARPLAAETHRGLGEGWASIGEYSRAAREHAAASEAAPWEPRYRELLVARLMDAGRYTSAFAAVEAGLVRAPHNFPLRLQAARILTELGRTDDAGEHYEHALTLEPHHPDLKIEAARFHAEHGAADRARELIADALAVVPDHTEALALREQLSRR